MKRTAALLVLVHLAFPEISRAQALPAPRFGVFDAGRVSSETALGKAITSRLNSIQEKKRAELQAKGKEIQGLQGQLETQALSLSPDRRSGLEKDIQRKTLELNQAQEAARNELQIEYNEEQEKFQQRILAAIEQLSRDEKFSLILEKNVVAFFDPSLDVTTALVDRFDKMFPPPAAEAAKSEEKK